MLKTYRIKEIAKLFGVHADTLRYYEEKGLISPNRSTNGYRNYTIAHLCQLNIIRILRGLDVPIGRIVDYMKNCTVTNTISLLEQQEEHITQEIKRLALVAEQLKERRKMLCYYQSKDIVVDEVVVKRLPLRRCYRLDERNIIESDVDFHLKQLENQHKEIFIGCDLPHMGAIIDTYSLGQKKSHYKGVFFWSEYFTGWDWELAQGEYACIYYKGSYDNGPIYFSRLIEHIKKQGYTTMAEPIELYHIDIHSTNGIDEFLTEIQIMVEKITK